MSTINQPQPPVKTSPDAVEPVVQHVCTCNREFGTLLGLKIHQHYCQPDVPTIKTAYPKGVVRFESVPEDDRVYEIYSFGDTPRCQAAKRQHKQLGKYSRCANRALNDTFCGTHCTQRKKHGEVDLRLC